jgi:hypothetical protein
MSTVPQDTSSFDAPNDLSFLSLVPDLGSFMSSRGVEFNPSNSDMSNCNPSNSDTCDEPANRRDTPFSSITRGTRNQVTVQVLPIPHLPDLGYVFIPLEGASNVHSIRPSFRPHFVLSTASEMPLFSGLRQGIRVPSPTFPVASVPPLESEDADMDSMQDGERVARQPSY